MNNFEECIKSPFDASNLEMLNPFRLLANTISVLLTTLTALISGIRSYIQSVLDTFFIRFKENKKTLSDIQIDIMKRFIGGVYGKLNSSFRSLRDSIGTFTDTVYEDYLEAQAEQVEHGETEIHYYRKVRSYVCSEEDHRMCLAKRLAQAQLEGLS